MCGRDAGALAGWVGLASLPPLLPPDRSSLPRGRSGRAKRCTEPRFRAQVVDGPTDWGQNVGWSTT
jgi:hypothetical protein